jgi:heme/copper-type cytochrome/quinol oxidase subunit 4
MPRFIVVLIVVVVVLIGGIWLLAGRDTHKEPTRIDKVVPLENLAN